MADPVAPAPAAAPAAAAPNPTVQRNPASGAAPRRAIITNPEPAPLTDEEAAAAEVAEAKKNPPELPQSTLDEMEAGRQALKRHKARDAVPPQAAAAPKTEAK